MIVLTYLKCHPQNADSHLLRYLLSEIFDIFQADDDNTNKTSMHKIIRKYEAPWQMLWQLRDEINAGVGKKIQARYRGHTTSSSSRQLGTHPRVQSQSLKALPDPFTCSNGTTGYSSLQIPESSSVRLWKDVLESPSRLASAMHAPNTSYSNSSASKNTFSCESSTTDRHQQVSRGDSLPAPQDSYRKHNSCSCSHASRLGPSTTTSAQDLSNAGINSAGSLRSQGNLDSIVTDGPNASSLQPQAHSTWGSPSLSRAFPQSAAMADALSFLDPSTDRMPEDWLDILEV